MANLDFHPISFPSVCEREDCQKNHWHLENGARFHAGLHVFIKGVDSFEVCNTKVRIVHPHIPFPKGVQHIMRGALDIRVLILQDKPRMFDYATEKFPNVVELLRFGSEGWIDHLREDLSRIWQDASELSEEM